MPVICRARGASVGVHTLTRVSQALFSAALHIVAKANFAVRLCSRASELVSLSGKNALGAPHDAIPCANVCAICVCMCVCMSTRISTWRIRIADAREQMDERPVHPSVRPSIHPSIQLSIGKRATARISALRSEKLAEKCFCFLRASRVAAA